MPETEVKSKGSEVASSPAPAAAATADPLASGDLQDDLAAAPAQASAPVTADAAKKEDAS